MPKAENWPRLSDTLPHAHPRKCGQCGTDDPAPPPLQLWQEHDANDKPELRFVLLCRKCSDLLIEKHPRLYDRKWSRNHPAPGAMEICTDCRFRDRLWCSQTKRAGGPGINVTITQGISGFIDGAKYSGPFIDFPYPADKAAQPAGHLHAEKLRAQAARLDADSVAKIREGNALFLEAEKL